MKHKSDIIPVVLLMAAAAGLLYYYGRRYLPPVTTDKIVATTPGKSNTAPDTQLVKVGLKSDTRIITAGNRFMIGIQFKIKPGWHIYWENPGDSGMATTVKLTVPEGFKAGKLLFPIPDKFLTQGNIKGYGYKDEVMLLAWINTPKKLPPGQNINIKALVQWLVCKDTCIPGSSELNITLPTAEIATLPYPKEFITYREKLPQTYNPEKTPFSVRILRKSETAQGKYIISLKWNEPETDIECFPATNERLTVEITDVVTTNNETVIHFSADKIRKDTIGPVNFTLLIVYRDNEGKRKGVEIPLNTDGILQL